VKAKKTFVSFKWHVPGYKTQFGPEHPNTLYSMLARNYKKPFELVIVTDDARGLIPEIRSVQLWNDYADVPSPHGPRFPSCYRRLKIFQSGIESLLGEDMVVLDLDCVITDNIESVVDRDVDFMAWGGTNKGGGYNCSLIKLRAGTRTRVWEDFDPKTSPALATAAGFIGSDQGWLTYCLGKNVEPIFTKGDGIYCYRLDIKPFHGALPENAKMVFFPGQEDPWSHMPRQLPWVKAHYR
jgi:hypothetical protein